MRGRPFVALNCAAFPESLLESELFGYEDGAFTGSRKGGKAGLFESAHTGTVFLDEVVRLGAVQPIPVDVRATAATHSRLPEKIAAGQFRADLFHRLNILRLALPPLREQPEDIGALALHMLQQSLRRQDSSVQAEPALAPLLPALLRYAWPGNVRELENIMERFAAYLASFGASRPIGHRGFVHEVPGASRTTLWQMLRREETPSA